MVEVARSRGLEARQLDVTDNIDFETDALPLADNSVDVVTAVSLIEHLRSPRMLLAETLRVLKPGGTMILVPPNWRYSYREFFDDPTHVHPYTDRSTALCTEKRRVSIRTSSCHGSSAKPVLVWTNAAGIRGSTRHSRSDGRRRRCCRAP